MSTGIDFDALRRSLLQSLASSGVAKLRIVPSSIRPIDNTPRFSGGFGEVQEATYHAGHSTTSVAVKELKPCGNFNQRLRVAVALIREVSVWSTLDHPNILALLGFDLDDHEFKRARLITSWKQNGHILDYVQKRKPSYTGRLELVIGTAKGLAYLHGLSPKVCHGDVKPENVLVDDVGTVKLCDFGLARILKDVPTGLTTTASPKMTFIYASPELAVNGASHTCEDDVWAWGCMVSVVMTGVLPYQEKPNQSTIIQAMVARVPPAELTRLPNLSFVLRQLLTDCWSWAPEDRPTMQQCELRLSSYSTTSTSDATTTEGPIRMDHSLISVTTSLTNLRQVPAELKVGGEDWYAIFNPHAPRKLDINLVHSFHHESIVSCVRFSSDGRFIATGSDTTAQIFNVETHKRICALNHTSAPGKDDSGIQSVCFSPDSNLVASGTEDGLIRVWNIATRKVIQTLEGHSDAIYSLAFSRDKQLVSGSEDETVRIWNLEAGTHRTLSASETEAGDSGVACVAISDQRKHIATGHMDSLVRIWDLASGDLVQCLGGHTDSVYGVAFTPDDKCLISGSLDNTVRYWDVGLVLLRPPVSNQVLPTNSASIVLSESEGHVLSVAISPDGAWVASGATDFGIQFSDPVTGLLQLTLKGHRNTVTDVDFSPVMNGPSGLLASASGDCTVNLCEPFTRSRSEEC